MKNHINIQLPQKAQKYTT